MKREIVALVLLGALFAAVIPSQNISAGRSNSDVDAEILDVRIDRPRVLTCGRIITVKVKIKNTGRIDYNFWVGLSFKEGGGRIYDIPPEQIYLSSHFWGRRSGTVTFKWEIPKGAYANSRRPLNISVAVWEGFDGRHMHGLITRYEDTTWVSQEWIYIVSCP